MHVPVNLCMYSTCSLSWSIHSLRSLVSQWSLVPVWCHQDSQTWGEVQKEILFSAKQLSCDINQLRKQPGCEAALGPGPLQLDRPALPDGLLCAAPCQSALCRTSLLCSALMRHLLFQFSQRDAVFSPSGLEKHTTRARGELTDTDRSPQLPLVPDWFLLKRVRTPILAVWLI